MKRKNTIIGTSRPDTENVNDLLQWFGGTLGLFSLRDKDSSCFRIFIILVRDLKADTPGLKSDDIARRTQLSRGTVIHHLKKLRKANIVVQEDNVYRVPEESLREVTQHIRRDINETLDALRHVAEELDEKLDLDG